MSTATIEAPGLFPARVMVCAPTRNGPPEHGFPRKHRIGMQQNRPTWSAWSCRRMFSRGSYRVHMLASCLLPSLSRTLKRSGSSGSSRHPSSRAARSVPLFLYS
jgi:hypothetical protein